MKIEDSYHRAFRNRMKHIRLTALVQIFFALAVIVLAMLNTWSGLYSEAQKTSVDAATRSADIIEGYTSAFRSILIPIRDKINENPSFDEMQNWLQSKETDFRAAVGAEAYDGIALTYQGGYAHSWNYGDYSDYDPTTRPWYQQAQQGDGEIVVVAPYVTYLSTANQAVDTDILMTIAQKYNDEISFDLDLKLPKIQSILQNVKSRYENETILIYNEKGQILSSTTESFFAHNVFEADEMISDSMVAMVQRYAKNPDKLQAGLVDGRLQFLYFSSPQSGSTVCVMVPVAEMLVHDFLFIWLVCFALIAYVIFHFVKSRQSAAEFVEKDHRLAVIEDAEQRERLYVNADQMTFSGNDMAQRSTENMTYQALFELIQSRIVERADLPRLEAFLGADAIQGCADHQYIIDKERFLMNMQNSDGEMHQKTIEMRRLGFTQDRTHMVEISMLDAAESVDLLKQALNEANVLKQEKEDEYNRFMGYICTAQDAVEELNVKEHIITRYQVTDGKLQKQVLPYPAVPFTLFHEEDREKAQTLYNEEQLAELCRTQSASYAELRMKWNSAPAYRWCNVIVLGLPITPKTPFNVLVLIKDTDEVKTKEIQQKHALEDAFRLAEQGSRAKSSFLSNMSHEIRTPLNAIIGYLTIADDADCTTEKKDYCIENCRVASRHLLQIINDVLDMSAIENGKLKIAHEEFDLRKEISDLTTIFYQNAREKEIRFETHVENVTEEWVIGDQLRVNQVLMNLLSNAVKFTQKDGMVELTVAQLRKDSRRVYMKFTIQDTGIGMSKDYMSRIFRPFEQENAGTAKRFGGSGLGLSITNNLVQLMGGKIDVRSEQGRGTAFEVTMFFDLATGKHVGMAEADYSHVHVLVVDDKGDECSYIKMMLKRCGAKADAVTSGALALKRIESRKNSGYPYDLCIIDWNMPEMNGGEVTRKIRSELGEKMPIIIATAYDISDFEEEAKAAGADKIVAKPLFQSTLFDILVSSFGSYDPEAKTTQSERTKLSGVHVLLAEDNPMNMDIAVTILEKAGVTVDQAQNGQQAVERFLSAAAGTYDLILMDVQMPVMDGYEATGKIRSSAHPEATTIPIIAMTANAFAEDVAQALSKGMNAHISKPISYDKLFALLKKYTAN